MNCASECVRVALAERGMQAIRIGGSRRRTPRS